MTTQQRHASSDGATSSDYGAAAVRPRDVRRRAKPGPKGWLKNPRPIDEGKTEPGPPEISAAQLDDAERALRRYLRERRGQLVAGVEEPVSAAVFRISKLAAEALSETGVAWWSGYAVERLVPNPAAFRSWNPEILIPVSLPWGRGGRRRHVGPEPPVKAEHECLWLDTSAQPAMIKEYNKHAQSWRDFMEVGESIAGDKIKAGTWLVLLHRRTPVRLETSWPRVLRELRQPITNMLQGKTGRTGKSGRPAFLAYATLGALLDTTPETIADLLGNYRRSSAARDRINM
jgi:hypothetical protein